MTIDDAAIGRLASDPKRPLFPLVRQAQAMAPLVIVLAFLPSLYAIENRTLSENGAWQGLVSLRCATAASAAEAVDPASLDPEQPFRFQPPLMTWLTALGMRTFGVGTAAGLVTAAYLCTAGVIVAGYVLGRRLGGEPLGLVTAALLATHPQILEGAQEPALPAVVALFAMLAMAGAVAHWQKSSALVSYQLLLGGLALGMCLLAGGPIALAVVAILIAYALFWKLDAARRKRAGFALDSTRFSRRTAIRSLIVLAATGFALGGWHALLMSTRHGQDFWEGWFAVGAPISAATDSSKRAVWDALGELNALAAPLAGLGVLGIFGIVREMASREEDSAPAHRALLLVWIAAALLFWFWCRIALGPGAPATAVWKTLLVIPLMIAAALGLIGIATRRVGFWPALIAGALSLVDTMLLLESRGRRAPALISPGESSGTESLVLAVVLAALLLAALGVSVATSPTSRDARRRFILSGLIFVLAFAQVSVCALTVRHGSRRDRELDELRNGLTRLNDVSDWVFVAPSPGGQAVSGQPPAQLRFTLEGLRPQAITRPETSWEKALADAPVAAPGPKRSVVFVTWSPRGRLRSATPPPELRSVAAPFLYGGLEVAAYVREPVEGGRKLEDRR